MYASFNLDLDIPMFKDMWGYKCSSPVPGTHYGTIKAYLNLKNVPSSKATFSQGDTYLCDLLNGKPICNDISICYGGVARSDVLYVPGAVDMQLGWRTYKMEFQRTPENNLHTFKMTTPIADISIPKGSFIFLLGSSLNGLSALKMYLNDPEKYHIGYSRCFLTTRPETPEEYTAIYNEERNWALSQRFNNSLPKEMQPFPTADEVRLDPLSYTDHKFPPAANFARILINGE